MVEEIKMRNERMKGKAKKNNRKETGTERLRLVGGKRKENIQGRRGLAEADPTLGRGVANNETRPMELTQAKFSIDCAV